MAGFASLFRESEEEMIIPDKHDPEQVMNVLLSEVRALSAAINGIKESLSEFKADQKEICRERIHDCKQVFGEVFGRLRVVEGKAAACDAVKKKEEQEAKAAPHWAVAKGTYWLVIVTSLLFLDVGLNIYRFFLAVGGGH